MQLATESTGSGPRLVLVHGFTQTGRSWRSVSEALAVDHEVVTVDAPGHGGSATVEAGVWDGGAAVVAAGGSGTYIGYSMGARFALFGTLARPEAVDGLVLLGVNPGIEDAGERAARAQADAALADSIGAAGVDVLERWLAQPLFASLPAAAADVGDRRRNTAVGLASSLRLAGVGGQEPVWDRVGAIAVPVLVVAGERDAKFRALGVRLADAIGPNATFEIVPDAGHAAHLERPDAFVGVVRKWLRR